MEFKIININSKYNVNSNNFNYILNHSGFLYNVWRNVPVYLVNEELMDILFPPEMSMGLDEDCMREMFNGCFNNRKIENEYNIGLNDNHIMEVDYHLRRLSECRKEIVSRGVYFRYLDYDKSKILQEKMLVRIPFKDTLGDSEIPLPNSIDLTNVPSIGDLINVINSNGNPSLTTNFEDIIDQHRGITQESESIYICMERIIKDAEIINNQYGFRSMNINEIVKIISASVVLHELTHAYICCNLSKYNTIWGKLIEESLVTAYVMAALKNESNFSVLKADLSSKSFEYRASLYFEDYQLIEIKKLIDCWRRNNSKSFLLFCPPSDTEALYRGRTGHWPIKDIDFNDTVNYESYPTEKFWKLIALEIIKKTIRY